MNTPILQAKNITKHFDYPIRYTLFENLDFAIYPSQTIAIKGASGEGKTTLLHILTGLASIQSGKILFQNEILKKPSPEKIGMIFQSYNLLEDLTVLENVCMPVKIARFAMADYLDRALELLSTIGLEEKKATPARFLSGGEKQRVAIARALLCNPKILLADEPSGNLDHHNSSIIHQLLLNHVAKEKKALVVATHDHELATMCQQIFLLQNKKISKLSTDSSDKESLALI